MPRYKLIVEYDGTGYSGWQKQADRPSVQAALEEALFRFCGERAEITGAGRTDAGVHALTQVAHIDLAQPQDPFRIQNAMNFHLHDEKGGTQRRIAVIGAEEVTADFHARFSATWRSYTYRTLNRRAPAALHAGKVWHVPVPLDARAMQKAARLLLGHHDFTSFRDSECQAKSPMKTLDMLRVEQAGEEIHLHTQARSFLHHQVRIIVGTLSLVGLGKWQPGQVADALAARDRCAAGPTAPPQGLYLTGVGYNEVSAS